MEIFEEFKTWEFLAGIGIFLFAMFSLENAIKDLAGRSFKRFIRKQTSTRLKSIASGTVVTAILQSSSAVSLMVLAFVGAGIMAMENAIGVILGSNIGTTATAWIVATVGFKLNIESFALIFIGIGGLILIFLGKSERYSNISKLLVSFGFLFMGLSYMKGSVEDITAHISIEDIPNYGIAVYLLVGAILTAAMQSSSATIAIILTGLNAHLLSFEDAAAMVIGANIGTTATILLGGIRSTQIKKRVALSHLIFNLFSAIIGLIILWPTTYLIQSMIGSVNENAVIGIAIFHTIFNVVGVIVFFPFIRVFARWLTKIVPDRTVTTTKHIHGLTPSVYDAAISGIRKEIIHLTEEVMKYNRQIVHEGTNDKLSAPSSIFLEKKYDDLKLLQSEIFKFASEVQMSKFTEEEGLELVELLHSARESLNSAKIMKDIRHDISKFRNEDNNYLQETMAELIQRIDLLYSDISLALNSEDHADNAGVFADLLIRLKNEDKGFVDKAMAATRDGKIKQLETSEVLLVNRSYIYSSRLLINSILDWKLTKDELEIFEKLISKN